MSIPDPSWLALCLLTETNKGHEAPFVAQVVLNRLRSRSYPNTLEDVILQPWQFSAFNKWTTGEEPSSPEDAFHEVYDRSAKLAQRHWQLFLECSEAMLSLPEECPILPPKTLNYWSPVSMVPKGSLPRRWNWSILRCFEVPGIDVRRFVWAETVPRNSPGTGRPEKFSGWVE